MIGGTGVLSSAVTAEALRQGISVTMINRGSRPIPQGVELIKADMNNIDLIQNSLKGRHFDAVADFLCYTPEQSQRSYNFYSQFADQYFYISSMAVYDKTVPGPLTEDHAKGMKIWKYSTDKWASEQLINKLSTVNSCKITIIRPGVTYGDTRFPYDISPSYGYHWTFAARVLSGKPIILCDGGIHIVKPLRVEDFAVGFVGLIGNPNAYGEAFNICADERYTYNDVLQTLGNYLNKEVKTIDIPKDWYAQQIKNRSGELLGGRCMDVMCSPEEAKLANQKIKTVVPEFHQTIGLEKGVKLTLDAYRNQNYQRGIDWRFDADTDRIIKKWCKKNHMDYKQCNLKFIDYLGNVTFQDRIHFWMEFYKESKCAFWGLRIVNKLVGIFH